MLIVGLTGGICSGKTTVSNLFLEKNICVADADIASREIVQPGSFALNEIIKKLGQNILINNQLNRNLLKKMIFHDLRLKKWIEQLTHPLIRDNLIQKIKSSKSKYSILSSPLLIESKQIELVNRILVIDFDKKKQAQRVQMRDNIHLALAYKIIRSQISQEERLKYANDIIYNSFNIQFLKIQVEKLHKKYLKL